MLDRRDDGAEELRWAAALARLARRGFGLTQDGVALLVRRGASLAWAEGGAARLQREGTDLAHRAARSRRPIFQELDGATLAAAPLRGSKRELLGVLLARFTRAPDLRGFLLLAREASRALSLNRSLEGARRAADEIGQIAEAALAGEPTNVLAVRIARVARSVTGAEAAHLFGGTAETLVELAADGDGPNDRELARRACEAGVPQEVSEEGSLTLAVPLQARGESVGALILRFAPGDLPEPSNLEQLTARAAAALAAAAREARKDRFLSFAAHELKTPLTSIKGFAYSLARRSERGEGADPRAVRLLERQAERLHVLLEEMLEVSRLETGRFVLHREQCALGELASAALRVLRKLGTEEPSLSLEGADEPLPLLADRDRIERALVALAQRACALGKAKIALRRDGEWARARLTWEGPPLAPADQARLFSSRWEEQPGPGKQGLGMGLALAKTVARMHGGTLWAEADAFSLELPLATSARSARVPAGGQILVVDDDEAIAHMLADLLCEEGFSARAAVGGRVALQMIEAGPVPDLLVLDLRMPDLDGPALLAEVRQRLQLSPRVVLLSADRAVATAAQELGADAFVEKPFAPENLLSAVQLALAPPG